MSHARAMMLKMRNLSIILLLVCLALQSYAEVLLSTKPITLQAVAIGFDKYTPCETASYDYFDSLSQSCKICPTGMVKDVNDLNIYGDSSSCICDKGKIRSTIDCSLDTSGACTGVICTSCATGKAVSSDLTSCMDCDISSTTGTSLAADGDCSCIGGNWGNYLQEHNLATGALLSAKICSKCPSGMAIVLQNAWIAGKYYLRNRYKCQSCPDPLMVMNYNSGTNSYSCTCPTGYSVTGDSSFGPQSCIPAATSSSFQALESSYQVQKFVDSQLGTVSLNSLALKHYYTSSATKCTFFGSESDAKACQILANLCVLTKYEISPRSFCTIFTSIMERRLENPNPNVQSITNWNAQLPWLIYANSKEVCSDTSLNMKVSLDNYIIDYVLAVYSLDGTFHGYEPLQDQFDYCSTGDLTPIWAKFGASIQQDMKCVLRTLLDQEQRFYELFAVLNSGAYYPIPVKIINASVDGVIVNPKSNITAIECGETDQLVRRFTLFDIVTGISSTSLTVDPTLATRRSVPEYIRYASFIGLYTNLVTGATDGSIYTPILSIEYTDVSTSGSLYEEILAGTSTDTYATLSEAYVEIKFDSRFSMEMSTFWNNFVGFASFFVCLTIIVSWWRYKQWSSRNTRVITQIATNTDFGGVSWPVLLTAGTYIADTGVKIYFIMICATSFYYFCLFKMQSEAANLLPPYDPSLMTDDQSPYYTFCTGLVVLTLIQTARIVYLVYNQVNADLIFLDWEPANADITLSSTSDRGAKKGTSVWRSIFIGNEWLKIQTARVCDLRLSLLLLILVLLGSHYQYDTLLSPFLVTRKEKYSSEDVTTDVPVYVSNPVLRFAASSFWLMLFQFGQWAIKFFLLHRSLMEPLHQRFIDLCTIAKVSIMVFDEEFHGYYLHCRSPHQFSEGTMAELVSMLAQESAGLSTDRVLEGTKAQIFEVFFSSGFRSQLDSLLVPFKMQLLVQRQKQLAQMRGLEQTPGSGGGRGGGDRTLQPNEKIYHLWKEITSFSREFVQNNLQKSGLRHETKQRTYWERLLGVAPNLIHVDSPSFLMEDADNSFLSTTFLGCEVELCIWNVLVYGLVDFNVKNAAVSAFICYITNLVLTLLRRYGARLQISRKTLIDERFLS